ncbi:TetR/AcrR family transcriptional regulator [Haloechinothrix sp. LS1_15]|uniref:TetR/AcrR family transcriptional regulator n=1 Tax=Haloechinothrix sp. LS1_15 TaxID=2652248 RepID=UPI002944EB78|nr:TetR/AcrR family transcriptional regulator [Haloechinothrix sp. LS1_15]MDV6012811.1 TetR/AcrR family transcriptional regulator [Haloechinothrix sp. LS1_15]
MTTEPSDSNPVTRSIALLWGVKDRPARGRKPSLTLDRIVDTAIAIADAEGTEALSMRRVARELGAGAMSLYRYVPGKAELLTLMLDRISNPAALREEANGQCWRGVLEAFARTSWRRGLAHPWFIEVDWGRPVLGPNSVAELEHLMAALDGLPLSDRERVMIVTTVENYVVGSARAQLLYARAEADTGVSHDEFWTLHVPVLEQAMESGEYPTLASADEDTFASSWEESFEFGLERILDGIERLVASRAAAG